jgi:phage tail-like protein
MAPVRPFALYRTRDQWWRAAHDATALDPPSGGVRLAFATDRTPPVPVVSWPAVAAGLAFDSACRLYHSLPPDGCVERVLWSARDAIVGGAARLDPVDLFELASPIARGSFVASAGPMGPLQQPTALAVDGDDRLFIADTGARRILVLDLASRRLLRRARLAIRGLGDATPIDLAADGRTIWVLTRPFAILRMTARSGPVAVDVRDPRGLLPAGADVRRMAVSPRGEFALLAWLPDGTSAVISLRRTEHLDAAGRPRRDLTVWLVRPMPRASDVEFLADGLLVVALGPGEDLKRFRDGDEDEPLQAKGYDGQGIVRTPDGRIAFWTERGIRHAVAARVRYVERGRVTTYALDGGEFRMAWGRLFLDACLPRGTDIRVLFATSDELPEDEPTIVHTPPMNAAGESVRSPGLTPPLLPVALEPAMGVRGVPIHRRSDGRELPWLPIASDDPFITADVPVQAGPGRYLWITLDLGGDGRSTPRVRCLRVERPGHDLMRRLPRIYSRDEVAASFLRRYLAMIDGVLTGLDDRAADRRALIDPASTPDELLPWLAGFVGLVLDERWPIQRRRALVAEAVTLFRFRGTIPGLLRFLELCLGIRPLLIEQFRVRGLGGAVLREATGPVASSPVLGAGFRVGGAVGEPGADVRTTTTRDAFATNAHRFSLIVPIELDAERLAATADLLEAHRPAHTIVELCPVGAGMRVGSGLHVGLSSVIGRSGGWHQLQLGASTIGTTGILGRPEAGFGPGSSHLGQGTRLG